MVLLFLVFFWEETYWVTIIFLAELGPRLQCGIAENSELEWQSWGQV